MPYARTARRRQWVAMARAMPNSTSESPTSTIGSGLMPPSSVNLLMIGMKMMIAGTASMKSPITMNSSTNIDTTPYYPAADSTTADAGYDAVGRVLDRLTGLRLDPDRAAPDPRGLVFRKPAALDVLWD